MYDPTIGRWLSEDPLGLAVDTNPVRYVHNGPTNFTDPTGLAEYDATGNAIGQGLIGGGNFKAGDVIKNSAEARTIDVLSGNLEGGTDSDFNAASSVLKKLGLPLPTSENGVYWGKWKDKTLYGTTINYSGLAGDDINFSFVSDAYKGCSTTAGKQFEEFLVTLYHEVQGHNIDEATHDNPKETADFEKKYEQPVYDAIAKAKKGGTWAGIIGSVTPPKTPPPKTSP